jgi:hypothetical protein
MTTLPPLSAASSAIVEAVKNKAMEISMTGDLEKVIEGYRTCAGLSIRSALQLAGGIDTSIRAEDVIENLKLIADNLDPKMTRKGMMRIEGKNLIKMMRTPEDYSDDAYDSLVDAMDSLLEQLTDEE